MEQVLVRLPAPQETGLVVKHLEEWDAEPGKVVRSLIKPSSRTPTNQWEAFFGALDAGNAQGMWFAASPLLLKLSGALVGVSLLTKALGGEGGEGLSVRLEKHMAQFRTCWHLTPQHIVHGVRRCWQFAGYRRKVTTLRVHRPYIYMQSQCCRSTAVSSFSCPSTPQRCAKLSVT